ncbi:hypothetical protein ACS0TY_013807 [Phlomoides rotata]
MRTRYSLVSRIPGQINYMRKVIGISDEDCINHLRMSRGVFCRFCHLLETSGGLKLTRNCTIAEQVAMFLSILAHHTKKCIVKSNHVRSGRTVSKHFHRVLNSVIRLHSILLSQPKPIDENCKTGGGDTLRGVWVLWMEHTSMLQSLLKIGLVIVT